MLEAARQGDVTGGARTQNACFFGWPTGSRGA
jgi:hypothetical protein